ncbi:MAG TPA: T9SS type A sorting domain-containing protein [Ginsengibacter sp.]
MQKHYLYILFIFCFCIVCSKASKAQDCSLLNASFATYESRCAATGAIKVFATGGSGSYKYKTIGPVNTNFTNTDSITGLSAGTYTVVVNDIVTNCTFTQTGIIVPGSYDDPRFTLTGVDVSCDNGNNGSITSDSLTNGRSPFLYTIVAPSPMGIGTSNSSGAFNNLIAGTYSIQLTDSCGGIQTRQVTINNYTWNIDSYVFNKISCDSATGFIEVSDSKGNVSTAGGIPGFSYGIVRQPGDTIWSNSPYFTFQLLSSSSFEVVAKDLCGNIKKFNSSVSLIASVDALVNITNKTCNTFDANLTGITNFFDGNFCLYDSSGNQLQCDSTGKFTGIPYGSYCIKAHDNCTDTIISRCFTATPPVLSIDANVLITNKICQSFTAGITGQSNLTNPQYCLYDSTDVLITCNTTGVFDSLSYGNYCIKTKDGCIDTTITRCFTALRPVPIVDSIIPDYGNCTNFGLHIMGDSLTNPNYCLYDSLGNLIQCDSTGIFDSIPLGNYCIHIYDACLDTTIIKCFTVGPPVIVNDLNVAISNKDCSSFTATAMSNNLQNPYYCLYDTANVLISCDSSGVFDNLRYGSYCIQGRNSCPDTTFTYCFSATPPVPSVNSSVSFSNYTCTMFTAKITGQHNLTNPQYCIYDSNDVQISCNTSGVFNNLLYGSYCIKIVDSCYDTTITKCFVQLFSPVSLSVSANKSCSYGYSKFNVTINGGGFPIDIKIYNIDSSFSFEKVYNSINFTVDSIPGPTGSTYKIIATDNCGNSDSTSVSSLISYLTHAPTVTAKCPGGSWVNGSGDIATSVVSNMGSLTVRIIKKDNVALSPSLNPNTVSGNNYTFQNLGPATYIVSYKANDGCSVTYYDTVTIAAYSFPDLSRSSAYQCDIGGFSVGAVISNGVGPFSYEIIGSTPSSPSILAGPQSDPLFNINNGTNYSLIRLRALDACGNASLADASILPLATDEIIATTNCFLQPTTLSVDSIYNSTYSWYKKTNITDTDSTLIGSASSYYIPTVLPSDTGIYICHIEVNSGCLKRTYLYDLNANCYAILPITLIDFNGNYIEDEVLLNWQASNEQNLKRYIIERKNSYNNFSEIGAKYATGNSTTISRYNFLDTKPDPDKNFYRLKLINNDNTYSYSKTILLTGRQSKPQVTVYPNPVKDLLNIEFTNGNNHAYKISLYNSVDQLMKETTFITGINNQLQITRTKAMSTGLYILQIIDETNNEQYTQKVIFR